MAFTHFRCPTPPRALPAVHPLRSTTRWVARAQDAFLDGRGWRALRGWRARH